MKVCIQCGQVVAEEIGTCPSCGAEVAAGRTTIDDYRILEVLHEGYSSILCKARRENAATPVLIRIFTPPAGVDARLANRLKQELEKLQALPETYFVRHLAIRQSREGLWYRISEWVDTLKWSTLLSTGRLNDPAISLRLFQQIASILDGLHRIGHIIPHLILDDILVYEGDAGRLKVKIDFKISRFLDPQLDRPGPMLARLLAIHPDIVNRRPLDHRSDIWSLGKAFVEVLSADPNVADLPAAVETLPVPQRIRTLLRLMLSDNPEWRPDSMAEVAEALQQVGDDAIQSVVQGESANTSAPAPALLWRMNRRMAVLAALLMAMMIAGGLFWYQTAFLRPDSEEALRNYANRYASSVAFVMVEYWLHQGGREVYRNRAEGTAFLADDAGFLLTNRHVACPWLEDARLMTIVGLLQPRPEPLRFGYRLYLWFEGQRAFSGLSALSDGRRVEDVYVVESAFCSDGPRWVWIAGVAPAPVRTRERVRSPLGDDFAVLRIEAVPPGLKPLPLARGIPTDAISKLTPLMTLGFPLGSRTQASTVNVSVTQGHVRRTFENMFQVDVSLHPGNSGGPVVDTRGRVVGLATNVAIGWAKGPVPVATPLSDIGLVLPVAKAAAFLEEIKAGDVKWNGAMDVDLEKRLKAISDLARRREWAAARDLADEELAISPTPPLVLAAAVMHLCAGDYGGGRRLLDQALSIDPSRHMTRWMLLATDWLDRQPLNATHYRILAALDWRSPDEFAGHLAALLAGEADIQRALGGGYTASEKSWLHLIAGLMETRHGTLEAAWPLLETAVLAADPDDWSQFLALAHLDRLQLRRMAQATDASVREEYQEQLATLDRRVHQAAADKNAQIARLKPITSALRSDTADLTTQRRLLADLRGIDRDNRDLLIVQAYYAAMEEDWQAALDLAGQYVALPGRTNAGKLSMGLFEAELLHLQGHNQAARDRLLAYQSRITDPWYRRLSSSLLDPALKADVTAEAAEDPDFLLSAHVALGLWAEGDRETGDAIRHYREALGSFVDHRIEYEFALVRMKRLRQPGD